VVCSVWPAAMVGFVHHLTLKHKMLGPTTKMIQKLFISLEMLHFLIFHISLYHNQFTEYIKLSLYK
jgi:hypothetical protein